MALVNSVEVTAELATQVPSTNVSLNATQLLICQTTHAIHVLLNASLAFRHKLVYHVQMATI